ncbi:hypothetical protein TorRG33x02_303590 [Trema orientale]|uniref:Uncharacterized protein n=1 Tax=Trema orientale TaxID=63057 RepID=A0A2P5BZ82_TREOI|nr:hypothetical protein TorRG33x02_303590 [Trema orientale]
MVKNADLNLIEQPEKVESDPLLKEIDDFEGGEEITSAHQDLFEGDICLSEQEAWSVKNATSKFTTRKYESKITRNEFLEYIDIYG